jgi:hypothetical protein
MGYLNIGGYRCWKRFTVARRGDDPLRQQGAASALDAPREEVACL